MEKRIVSNSSSIIFLGKINRFDLLKNIYKKILISKEVINEIFKYNKPENNIIKKEIDSGFIKIEKVKKPLNFPLHLGERSVISLCIEKDILFLLSDDKKARRYALSLDIKVIGIAGIILRNLQLRNINKKQTKSLINQLIKKDYYISPELYFEVMKLINSS